MVIEFPGEHGKRLQRPVEELKWYDSIKGEARPPLCGQSRNVALVVVAAICRMPEISHV